MKARKKRSNFYWKRKMYTFKLVKNSNYSTKSIIRSGKLLKKNHINLEYMEFNSIQFGILLKCMYFKFIDHL